MKRLIAASSLLLFACSATATAEEVVRDISWRKLNEAGKLLDGQLQVNENPQAADALKVDSPENRPNVKRLLVLDRPELSKFRYAIVGEVAHENVTAGSHLEMWNTFSGGQMYFTKSMAPSGPLKELGGTSDWRPFVLPFFSAEEMGTPIRIELNVVFTAVGSVSLRAVRLVEYSDDESPMPDFLPSSYLPQPPVKPRQVGQISWKEFEAAGRPLAGRIVDGQSPDPIEQLHVEHSAKEPQTVSIAAIDEPQIKGVHYDVRGWVRHEDVAAGSYLEMWSTFADGSKYFTRTMSQSGPMRNLDGSSGWRPVELPFHSNPATGPPTRLEINVVFGGPGKVQLGPLAIEEFDVPQFTPPVPATPPEPRTVPQNGPGKVPGAWWDDRTAGLMGGIAGSTIGILYGLIGTLAGLGKLRRLVVGLAVLLILLGIASLVIGLVALTIGQPYAVYYPLLLLGGIPTIVMSCILPTMRRRYEKIELRKMAAMDMNAAGGRAPH